VSRSESIPATTAAVASSPASHQNSVVASAVGLYINSSARETAPPSMVTPPPSAALVVFALVAVAVLLFATELLSPDVTAIAVIVAVAVLEPWTGVGADEAFVGFANTATITVIAMFMLSERVHRSGLVRRLATVVSRVARGSDSRLLATVLVLAGGLAGVVNNTPVVGVFTPVVTELAEEYRISPSKLLRKVKEKAPCFSAGINPTSPR
jgi:di/tricarboxylate transporter